MNDRPKDFPEVPRHDDTTVNVLSVSGLDETHLKLRGILRHTSWLMQETCGCTDAIKLLRRHRLGVVVCERDLPDGSWLDLLRAAQSLDDPPMIIVTCRDADEQLWGEVLDRGGYDVLPKPLDASEVTRIISLAWSHWRHCTAPRRKRAGGAISPAALQANAG